MDGVDNFYYYLFNNLNTFFLYLILIGCFHFFFFKKYIYSFFDPFLLTAISITFYSVDVIFMYHMNIISSFYFIHYILTQFLFLFGFMIFRPMKIKDFSLVNFKQTRRDLFEERIFFYIASFLFIFTQLLSFIKVGIPLFMEARLSAYHGGDGSGMLARVIFVTLPITIFLLVGRLYKKKESGFRAKILEYFILFFALIGLITSGAKSSILIIVNLIFIYSLFFCRFIEYKDVATYFKKYQKLIFSLAVFAALMVIAVESYIISDEDSNLLIKLVLRFVQSGDVFMMAYQNDVLDKLTQYNPFIAVFADFLGLFRIIPWESLPQELGNQLYQYNIGGYLPKGPNPVHNVFGLFYFGYPLSLIYSFSMGIFLSFARNRALLLLPNNIAGSLLFMFSILIAPSFSSDITYAIQQLNNIFLIGGAILILVKVLSWSLVR
jgi:hypothetical protein